MSGLGKGGYLPTGVFLGERRFSADMLQTPCDDWPISHQAAIEEDISGVSDYVRCFPISRETGIGFALVIPENMRQIHVRCLSRPRNKPKHLSYVVARLSARSSDEAWIGPVAAGFIPIVDQSISSVDFTLTLAAVSAKAGGYNQFELTRNPGGPGDLQEDWLLHEIGVTFS